MLIPPGKRYIFEGEYPDMKKFGLCITTITFYNELGDFLESGDGEPVYIDNYGQMGTFRDCNSGPQTAPNGMCARNMMKFTDNTRRFRLHDVCRNIVIYHAFAHASTYMRV